MFFISNIQTDKPSKFETALQEKVYATLMKLHIPFERVDTDEAITMEDCTAIEEKLDMKMVKTLLLCNRRPDDVLSFYHLREQAVSFQRMQRRPWGSAPFVCAG